MSRIRSKNTHLLVTGQLTGILRLGKRPQTGHRPIVRLSLRDLMIMLFWATRNGLMFVLESANCDKFATLSTKTANYDDVMGIIGEPF